MAKESIDEVQADLDDNKRSADSIAVDIDNAMGCETKKDLIANLESALEAAKELVKELKEQLARAKAASED